MDKIQKIETNLSGHWANDNELTRSHVSQKRNKIDLFIESLQDNIDTLKRNNEISPIEKQNLFNKLQIDHYESEFNIIAGRKYSTTIQKWIGYITEINDETFSAKLIDKTNKGTNEIVEFSKDELSPDDLPLFRMDAIFYWSIGYSVSNGQKRSESILKFKRSAVYEDKDLDKGLDVGNDIFEGIDWED
jgi:hypothetical protein